MKYKRRCLNKMNEKKMTSIGGQAVIEGVMMRGPHKIATAVRKPDGEIIIDEKFNFLRSFIVILSFSKTRGLTPNSRKYCTILYVKES